MGFKRRPKPERKRRRTGLEGRYDDRHRWMLSLLRDYVAKHGWDAIKPRIVVPPGAPLGNWIQHRRSFYKQGRLAHWLIEELESIPGWMWQPRREKQECKLALLYDFLDENTWDQLTGSTVYKGVKLGVWVLNRRQDFREDTIDPCIVDQLEAVPGWTWNALEEKITHNLSLLDMYTTALPARDLLALGRWVRRRRLQYRKGELNQAHITECESIPGWTWAPNTRPNAGA